jgi:Zn-dependent peptidase ImmA (M78 family)
VKALPLALEGYFGLCIGLSDGGPAIVVTAHNKIPVERWIFTVAHELAHLLLRLSSFEAEKVRKSKPKRRKPTSSPDTS